MCNLELWQPPILNFDGIPIILNTGWKIWLPKAAQTHPKLVSLLYIVVVYTISLIAVLAVLFVQSNQIILTHLSEIADQEYPCREFNKSTCTHTYCHYCKLCGSPSTLHAGATGNRLLPVDASGPRIRTPLRPLILKCELTNHPDKAFVQQLIFLTWSMAVS